MTVGTILPFPPEPHRPDSTRYIQAGVLTFGVEHRSVDAGGVRESFKNDQEGWALIEPYVTDDPTDTDELHGVSIHVFDSSSNHEHLRFDCFDARPHYHYLHRRQPGNPVVNHAVQIDSVAVGDPVRFALECLGTRLPEMLAQADGAHLVPGMEEDDIRRALEVVGALAVEIQSRDRQAG